MPISYLPYDLQRGYVHQWLVAGPQAILIQEPESLDDEAFKAQTSRDFYEAASGIHRLPVEPGPLEESAFTVGDYEERWAYYACAEDHYVDLTDFYPSYRYLRAWAYTQLVSAHAQTVSLILTAHGPVDVWLNGSHVHRSAAFGFHQDPLEVSLREGANELVVRFEQVGARACRHQLALRVSDPVDGVHVQIPTAIEDVAYRNRLESMFQRAYLDRDVFARDEMITVHWPEDLEDSEEVIIRLQTPTGRIYAEHRAAASPGERSTLVQALQAPPGSLRLRFMPQTRLFYDEDLRIVHELPMWGAGWQSYSDAAYGTFAQRRKEAIGHAMRGDDVWAQIAMMVGGQWRLVAASVILEAIEAVNRHEVNAPLYLVGLLGMVSRWGEHTDFPASVRSSLEGCVLGFRGWADEPASGGFDAASESTRILLHASEILAGQLLPDRAFSASGQTGRWHRERGERLALEWLRRRGREGFAAWDSPAAFEAELVALSHLMDLSQTEAVWQMVAVILDKLLFTVALNSYKGVFGATQGAADASSIKGGLLTQTAGITRLLWGEGTFNQHLAGVVSLACMEDYELPPLVPDIAMTERDELWDRECHATGDGETVNKVTYRTPDYLLGSVQDYRAGERGEREHVWQATLGPEAVVYTTHPASVGRSEGHTPGLWLGNATLPRVAQWKDALVAVYRLPNDDWMGYTHAYFPAYAFDAYVMRQSARGQPWAFARKGDGYLALTASRGLTWITEEPGAYRELRSHGRETVWCCQMGRAALDGDFEAFQERVLSLPLSFEGLTVRFETLRGDALAFGWEGPLMCNGKELPLSGFKHYENPYCVADLGAPEMEIRSDQYLMRLKFS
ncbi:MAG: hypothetical protein ACP5HG_10090 [Anaerolineae bacterium]